MPRDASPTALIAADACPDKGHGPFPTGLRLPPGSAVEQALHQGRTHAPA